MKGTEMPNISRGKRRISEREIFISVSKGTYEFSQEKEEKRTTIACGVNSINKDKGKECHNVC